MNFIPKQSSNQPLYFVKNKTYLLVFTVIFCFLLLGCNNTNASDNNHNANRGQAKMSHSPYKMGNLYLPNSQVHKQIQTVLTGSRNKRTHFIQLGDSHTAADVFTGEIRKMLQKEFGNGGIGFIQPTNVTGIRSDLLTISGDKNNFALLSSRNEKSPIFPLGGYLLDTKGNAGNIILSPRSNLSTNQKIQAKALYFTQASAKMSFNGQLLTLKPTNNIWQWSSEIKGLNLPITIAFSKNNSLKIGGYYLENSQDKGIVYSALGINGAQINYWDRWHHSWKESLKALAPDVMLIAYGTNEAFGNNLDIVAYKKDLNQRMQSLKRTYPNTLFVVIGPPDSLKTSKKGGSTCDGDYSKQLAQIIAIQKELALNNAFIFWNWQESMGGSCSIKQWLSKDLAKPDLVHLTSSGYSQSAEKFVQDLKAANSKNIK